MSAELKNNIPQYKAGQRAKAELQIITQSERAKRLKIYIDTLKDKTILEQGVDIIEDSQTRIIGPLASCNGLVIPMEKGAIIGHFKPELKNSREDWDELINQVEQHEKKIDKDATVFIFEKLHPFDEIEKNREKTFKEVFKNLGFSKLVIVAYADDMTYLTVNTKDKVIMGAIFRSEDLELEPNKKIQEIKY